MSEAQPVAAVHFDGRTSRGRPCRLRAHRRALRMEFQDGATASHPPASFEVSEPVGRAPYQIRLADGACCEVADHAGLAALLRELGHRGGWVSRMQESWRATLASFVLVAGVLGAAYLWGLPWAAGQIAESLPAPWLQQMSGLSLAALGDVLKPSEIEVERQHRLAKAFSAMQRPGNTPAAYRLYFRGNEWLGANAFALPNGDIVVLDDLVKLAGSDGEILAVLAHELGHVHHRHGLRRMIQGSIVAAVAGMYLNDFSSLLSGATAMVLETRYSRDMEREADDYGIAMLKANGLAPGLLADMLERLEQAHEGQRRAAKPKDAEPQASDYFSTHPSTDERIRRIRGLGN